MDEKKFNEKYVRFINSITIENVESLITRLKKSIKFKIILIIIALISFAPWGPFGPFFVVFLYFGVLKAIDFYLAQGKFMRNYAVSNNFLFQNTMDRSELKGRLFTEQSGYPSYILIGEYKKFPIKIFNYSFSKNSKNNKRSSFTVCEITIENTKFPHIFLKSNSMFRQISQNFIGQNKDIKINLPQDIENNFTLFCTQNYEIEVLEIFTPDVLLFLKTNASNFSIEFAENKIYFYDDVLIKNEKGLDQLYTVVQKVLDSSGQLFNRLHDDFEAMDTFFKEK